MFRVKTNCPICGIITTVELTSEEVKIFFSRKKYPIDFQERRVCDCCIDEGFNVNEVNKLISLTC